MSDANDTYASAIERELENKSTDDRVQAVEVLGEDMERIAEETDAECVLVRVEPLSKDQHEANEALRQLVEQRSVDTRSDRQEADQDV